MPWFETMKITWSLALSFGVVPLLLAAMGARCWPLPRPRVPRGAPASG
jgi:hypothetical protein